MVIKRSLSDQPQGKLVRPTENMIQCKTPYLIPARPRPPLKWGNWQRLPQQLPAQWGLLWKLQQRHPYGSQASVQWGEKRGNSDTKTTGLGSTRWTCSYSPSQTKLSRKPRFWMPLHPFPKQNIPCYSKGEKINFRALMAGLGSMAKSWASTNVLFPLKPPPNPFPKKGFQPPTPTDPHPHDSTQRQINTISSWCHTHLDLSQSNLKSGLSYWHPRFHKWVSGSRGWLEHSWCTLYTTLVFPKEHSREL